MASSKMVEVRGFEERKEDLEGLLRTLGKGAYHVERIDDRFGPAARRADLQAIVVSEETVGTADDLNEERERRGLPPLKVVKVPLLPAEDGLPISSSRIRSGEIDATGRVLRALKVFVGTGNDVKVR